MSKKAEKGIIIDGIDVFACHNLIFEHHDGRAIKINVCECGLQGVEYYSMMCSNNPDCYYKQLQRGKQRNEILLKEIEIQNDIEDKYWQILKDIEEIAKAKVHTPHCFENPNCPVELVRENTSKISKYCPTIIEKYCPIKLLEEILKKTKEVENEE